MLTETPSPSSTADVPAPMPRTKLVYYYLWFILKNIIGWALILASGPIGLALPGPGGLPLFIIGFAMITFPGKRALTSRVLRGRTWAINGRWVVMSEALASFILPAVVVWITSIRFRSEIQLRGPAVVWTAYALAVVVSFLVVRVAMRVMNYAVTFVPMIRRKVRPWMRHKGIDLLPPRRRKRLKRTDGSNVNTAQDPHHDANHEDTGILELDPRFGEGLKSFWLRAKPWVFVATGLAVTVSIVYLLVTRT